MPTIFHRWSSHDTLSHTTAERENVLNDVIRDFLKRKGQKAGEILIPPAAEVYIDNQSQTDRAQYSIVQVGTPLVYPAESDICFFGKAVFKLEPPASGAKFAILQEPCRANGDIIRAIVSGWSLCKVKINALTHEYAVALAGNYDYLNSQKTVGTARIIVQPRDGNGVATLGTQWCIVEFTQSPGTANPNGDGGAGDSEGELALASLAINCTGLFSISGSTAGAGDMATAAMTMAGTGTYTALTFTGSGAMTFGVLTIDSESESEETAYEAAVMFRAALTAPVYNATLALWTYDWQERIINTSTGGLQNGTHSGTTSAGPYMVELNNTLVQVPVTVFAFLRGIYGGQPIFDFEFCCDADVISSGSGDADLILGVLTMAGTGQVDGYVSPPGGEATSDLLLAALTMAGTGEMTGYRSPPPGEGTSDLLLEALTMAGTGSHSAGSGSQSFTTPGSSTFTATATATHTFRAYGAGAGAEDGIGAGGVGGNYRGDTYSLTSGDEVTITVGAGGTHGVLPTAGGDSSAITVVGTVTIVLAKGGNSGTAETGATAFSGGTPGSTGISSGGGGGGGAGSTANGGNGGNGSGTTGRVAVRHGRNYVGIDISREYLVEQATKRIDNIQHVMGGL